MCSTPEVVVISAARLQARVVPLLINVVGLWGVGLAGGYVIGLTDALDLSAIGIADAAGRAGFWMARDRGDGWWRAGYPDLFLAVSSPFARGPKADAAATPR